MKRINNMVKQQVTNETNILYPDESYRIIGACFNVYKEKGAGFLEAVYQECLAIELDYQTIPYEREKLLHLQYCGKKLEKTYCADFLCYDKIILELKAVSNLTDDHRGQIINYLNATGMKLGLLINFGHYPKLEYERYLFSEAKRNERVPV